MSKYIVIMWTRYDDEVRIRQFDTESEAQDFMKTDYEAVLINEKEYENEIYDNYIDKTNAKIETSGEIFLWQIEEIKF